MHILAVKKTLVCGIDERAWRMSALHMVPLPTSGSLHVQSTETVQNISITYGAIAHKWVFASTSTQHCTVCGISALHQM